MSGWVKESFSYYDLQRMLGKLIDSVKVFSGFSQAELGDLLSSSEKCTFQAGETILSEGSTGNFMYVLVEGAVKIVKKLERGGTKVLAELSGGECFGEMALVDNSVRSASVVTLTPCVLIRLSDTSLGKNPELRAKLYRNIASLLSSRLRHSNAMISLALLDDQ